jgi:hypothetical protein
MDTALLVRDLVPLLDAYEAACVAGAPDRLDLADAILQGISADPELLLTRLDLLTPCTMIEDLFVDCRADGDVRYTPMGEEHLAVLARYAALIRRLAEPLEKDAIQFAPLRHAYSPLGLAYGFCADILSSMVMEGLSSQSHSGLGLEEAFVSRGRLDEQRERADGWAALPARPGGQRIEYSSEYADRMFEGTLRALHAQVQDANGHTSAPRVARLFVVPDLRTVESLPERSQPDAVVCAQEHFVTSDVQRALASGATAFPRSQIIRDRREGRFLASVEIDGKWFGISKVVLTLCTSQGKDALVTGVPRAMLDVLRLTCPGICVMR